MSSEPDERIRREKNRDDSFGKGIEEWKNKKEQHEQKRA